MNKTKPTVKLSNCSGDPQCIISKTITALCDAGQDDKVLDYQEKAMAGDYDNLLRVTMKYVDVE